MVVDLAPAYRAQLAETQALGIPLHRSLEDFYHRRRADLAVLFSPIHLHCPQICLALSKGSFVLCEKPPAATIQEVDNMIRVRGQTRRWLAAWGSENRQPFRCLPFQDFRKPVQIFPRFIALEFELAFSRASSQAN